MKLGKLDHIGVAVRSIDEARPLFAGALGGEVESEETIESMKLRVCKIRLGGAVVELLEGQPGEQVVAKFLDARGEGLHHLCYAVADVRAAQAELEGAGYRAVWPEPRKGSSGRLVTFLHPRRTHGVLIELTEA